MISHLVDDVLFGLIGWNLGNLYNRSRTRGPISTRLADNHARYGNLNRRKS